MITGATRGGGGRKLAAHLADAKGHNVETEMGATRGLGATEIRAALRELDAGAAGGHTDRHAYHLHLDPGPAETWTDDTRRKAWARLETEMGLTDAAFVEVRHVTWRTLEPGDDLDRVRAVHGAEAMREKGGRHQVLMAHEHRVYDLTRDDGSVIDTAHDFARREKVGRVFEHDHGFDLVSGRHNRAVAARLDGERPDVAAAIRAAGLTDGPRPQASISPRARAQAERTGVDPATVGATVLDAWGASDGGAAFVAALREQGLVLARGTKTAVIVDAAGGVHPLARMLGKESKIGGGDRITATDVAARLAELDLPSVDQARSDPATQTITPATHSAQQNVAGHGNSIKKGQQDADAEDANARTRLDDRRPKRDRGPGPAKSGRGLTDAGPSRLGPRPFRGDPGGYYGGLPTPASETARATAGGRNEPAGPSGDPSRNDRREPGQARAQAGRDRITARRTATRFAAAVQARGSRFADLTRLVASPPTVASVQTNWARAAIALSRERVTAVMATAPWPDPADRRLVTLQDAERDQVKSAMAARATAAEAAVTLADQLRSRVGFVSRALALVGVETPAVRAAADAARKADQAGRAAKDSRIEYKENLAQADRSGSAQAERRQREQDRWEDRPDVRAARREEAGNELVAAALRAGDPEIKEVLRREDGLRIARQLIARRKAERHAEIQSQLEHQTTAARLSRRPSSMPAVFRI